MTDARGFRYRCVRGDARHSPGAGLANRPGEGAATPRPIVALLWDQLAATTDLPRWRVFPVVDAEQALDRLTRYTPMVIKAGLEAYVLPRSVDPAGARGANAFCRAGRPGSGPAQPEPPSPLGWADFIERWGGAPG